MSDFEAIASRLYGGATEAAPTLATETTTPAEATPAQPADAATETASEPAAVELPEAVRALRDAPERRMFSAQGAFASVNVETAAPQDVAELREILADVGASGDDARELMTLAGQMLAIPATSDARAQMRAVAEDAVRRQYGADAEAALADARAFIARDPRVVQLLNRSGLGDHPNAVLKVIQLARSAKMRGAQ